MRRTCLIRMTVALLLAVSVRGEAPLDDALRAARVRLLGAERGYVLDAEWRAAFAEAKRLESRAAAARDWPAAVTVVEMRGLALSFVGGDPRGAAALVRQGRARYGGEAPGEMRRLFLVEAEALARAGDPVAIRRLMVEFRNSPFHDAVPFRYSVGEGRDTPLAIQRPHAAGENSITITAMTRYLRQASAAPGNVFPDFEALDIAGRRIASADLRGRPTVVIFWVSSSPLWERRREDVARVLARRQADPPKVLAICQDLDGDELRAVAAGEPLRLWQHIGREQAAPIAARLGLFGEPEVFVLDRDGRIVARGVSGPELAIALDRVRVRP